MNFLDEIQQRLSRAALFRLLASIGLAVILWSFVTFDQDPEITRTFPGVSITVANLDESLQVVAAPEDAVVRLTGPTSIVAPIEAANVQAEIDLAEISEPGEYQAPIEVRAPDGVWRSSVTPSEVSVVVDNLVEREFPLSIVVNDTTSTLAVDVMPAVERVTVRGPNAIVDQVSDVVLVADIFGASRVYEDTLVPIARDVTGAEVEGVEIEPSAVRATISVSTRGKNVAVLVQITGSPAPGFEVVDRTANPSTILVDGPQETLDGLVAVRTEPVDVSGAQESLTERTTITDVPAGVSIIEPQSGEVDVFVQIGQRGMSQALPGQRVGVLNLQPGVEASVEPQEITIQVVAPADVLETLGTSNIRAYIDARELGPGTYELTPTVAVPPRVQWVSSQPPTVQVTIEEIEDATPSVNGSPQAAASPIANSE